VATPGETAVLEGVAEQAEDDESFLYRNRLCPGAILNLLRIESFNQAVCVRVDGAEVMLGARRGQHLGSQPTPGAP
jgi:hypothetical protein